MPTEQSGDYPWEWAWGRPQEVSEIDLAFPARGLELAPSVEQVAAARAKWSEETWILWERFGWRFFYGTPKIERLYLKDGIDGDTAWKHLQVVAGCYGFRQQDKEAALEYLADRWFEGIEYEDTSKKPVEPSVDPVDPMSVEQPS
jgi:hypothetical protein